MTNIVFLGLGAMGSRMAANLIKAGYAVTVWNRDSAKAAPLLAQGAKFVGTPKAAAASADIVIAMVRDDEASGKVWLDPETGALNGMTKGALAIECSTLTVKHMNSLHSAAAARGILFVDAPLAGSRPQAEAAQLIFFAGGDAKDVAAAEPALKAMGSAVHHAGSAGSGAAVKLMVNALFGIQLAALGELIGLAKKSGLDAARTVEIMAATPVVSPAAKVAAGAMLAGNFAPLFPIELVAKDFGYVVATAATAGAKVPMSQAAFETFSEAASEGHGGKNITGVVARYMAWTHTKASH